MQSVSESKENNPLIVWKGRLDLIQTWLVIAYAASLSLPITIPWIVLTVGLVAWGAQSFIRFRLKEAVFIVPPLAVPIGALAVTYFISGMVNGGLKEAFASVGIMRTFLVYFWAFSVFVQHDDLKAKAVPSALVLGGLAGLVATVQQVFDIHAGYKYLQGTGFLSGPMAFAGVMQILSLIGLAAWGSGAYKLFSGHFKNVVLFGALATANILGLVFASERSAWAGFFVGTVIIAACISRKLVLKLGALGIVAALIGWFCVPMVQARLMPLLTGKDVSSEQRMHVWSSALQQYQESPTTEIIGVGPRRFKPLKVENLPEKQELDHAHSNYLQSLTTTGAVGLLIYLWLCIASLRTAWLNFSLSKADNEIPGTAPNGVRSAGTLAGTDALTPTTSASTGMLYRGVSLGILGGLVSLMVAGIFEYNFGTGNVRLAQWFVLAMLTRGRK